MRGAGAALCAALGLAAPCFAQIVAGSGHAATEQRAASAFTRLTASAPARIELLLDGGEGLTVTADDNVLAHLETVVLADELFIRLAPPAIALRPATPIRITVHARSVDRIGLTGSARLEAPKLQAERVRIDLAGTAEVLLPGIEARELVLHASGHCHGMVGGRADSLDLWVAGSGKGEFNAARLETRRATVSITGPAQSALWVRDALHASVTGGGAVRYFGDPAVEKRVVGPGVVERLGAAPP